MALKVAARGLIPPFIVMDVMRAANEREAAGGDVIHLEVGQPSTGAPAGVIAAAQAALSGDRLGYTDACGVPSLRAAIVQYYRDFYGIDVPQEQVFVTTGSSGGFVLSFLAAFDRGDRVALADPGYPAYRNILNALGMEVVNIPTGPDSRFQPHVEHLRRIEGGLDGLIIASPSNPTGTMLRPEELRDISRYCDDQGIRLVSDEIYHGITFGVVDQATARTYSDNAIIVNSFSKYFSMTGWRLGWMVVPSDLQRAVECLAQNLFISPPTLSQIAAVAAFDCHSELGHNVEKYAANRALLLEELPKAGFDDLASADGAFYIYANVSRLTNDSEAFCRQMLAQTGIAATPGTDFDPHRGHAYVRFSFARSTADMAEAARRLQDWMA
ncbi:MAG: aminotransferase class I/II-fold pyridoxal phosphate-dependent enzyme [Alphaproteobacteria bacterium]|nr:aminotransferase class I/II-fold pyridoxal phosphate-dependent enzyme [Alphaproteobacteria bacterium]